MNTKTIEFYLKQLPGDIRQKAISYSDTKTLNETAFSLGHALVSAFSWSKTKEGYDYWDKIYWQYADN